jgi:ribosomal protein L37AE/L43A
LTRRRISVTLDFGVRKGDGNMTPEEAQGADKRFCPYCFMQQFEVTETSAGSVYCEVCGLDVAIKDLVRL